MRLLPIEVLEGVRERYAKWAETKHGPYTNIDHQLLQIGILECLEEMRDLIRVNKYPNNQETKKAEV